MQSAWLYDVLAKYEAHSVRAQLFKTLAGEARDQASHWQTRLVERGQVVPPFLPSMRARIVAMLVTRLGVRTLKQILGGMKIRGMSTYAVATPSGHVMPTTLEPVAAHSQVDFACWRSVALPGH
jgi:hypothetical protein